MKVVTIGGGHGQAVMLRALLELDCEVTAVVGIADDGGCSGRLRAEFDMPPPGDLRRCLTALARHRGLAERFEERCDDEEEDDLRRSVGNLALFDVYLERGSLAEAVRWAEELLQCRGRVVPAADAPGQLTIYDKSRGVIEGETTIEREGDCPVVVGVHGPEVAFGPAREAIEEADLLLVGPGSFVTSTLAAVMTGDLAEAIVTSEARLVLVQNLVDESGHMKGVTAVDRLRLFRDHLFIGAGTDAFDLSVLAQGSAHGRRRLDERTLALESPLTSNGRGHDHHLVATALRHHFGMDPSDDRDTVDEPRALEDFERCLASARGRLRERASQRGG
ncbi:MAG TPA: YvcK family protein [Polyangiaceae bacterium]|nr:YvcK family protein [Polyangiaceae bacterium]